MTGSESENVAIPTLILTGGALDGTAYPLRMDSREVRLGSSGETDVQIGLGNVDPVHARLAFGPSGLSIADAGSATGTFVNGERVQGELVLQDGDRICLGPPGAKESAKLLVRLPGGPPIPSGAVHGQPAGGSGFLDVDAGPVLFGAEEDTPLQFGEDDPVWPPPAGAPSAPSPPPHGPEVQELEFPVAEEDVLVGSGPPLIAEEVSEPSMDDSAFSPSPFPTDSPQHPPLDAEPAAPTPPPVPRTHHVTLTAPAPEEEPRRGTSSEMPHLIEPPPPRPPSRGPRAAAASPRGRRPTHRGRRSALPVVPLVGGLVLVAAAGGAVWWFFLRAAPASAPTAAPGAPTRPPAAVPGKPARAAAPSPGVTLQPDVALPGESVLIRGLPQAPATVTIGGAAAEVTETTAEGIRVLVPNLPLSPGQSAEVVVRSGSAKSPKLELVIGRLPLILGINPARGALGDRVVLTGRGFDTRAQANTVTFGGAPALVLAASATELTVVVPPPPTGGTPDVPVVVSTPGRTSGRDRSFTLQRSVTSAFVPRFFAAPVTEHPGEDFAFVSTELAPVLLFGGPGTSGSTALRAADVAASLNRLVERAASRRVDVELRDRPSPSVAVVGEARPLLSATPEDVAAYARGWDPSARHGPRLSTQVLTRHWAALLRDYFGLFLYRERPLEVAALSPRGAVFREIYSEATRRQAGGTGVPASVVYPPTEAMAASLRLAALVPSTDRPREWIAVEGRWQGTIDDPDTGSRRFEVRFEASGGGLRGSLTTWRGKLELSAPLRDVSFSRGTLRFTADQQGTAHRFEGTLHDVAISGAAAREGRAPAPFSLQLAE